MNKLNPPILQKNSQEMTAYMDCLQEKMQLNEIFLSISDWRFVSLKQKTKRERKGKQVISVGMLFASPSQNAKESFIQVAKDAQKTYGTYVNLPNDPLNFLGRGKFESVPPSSEDEVEPEQQLNQTPQKQQNEEPIKNSFDAFDDDNKLEQVNSFNPYFHSKLRQPTEVVKFKQPPQQQPTQQMQTQKSQAQPKAPARPRNGRGSGPRNRNAAQPSSYVSAAAFDGTENQKLFEQYNQKNTANESNANGVPLSTKVMPPKKMHFTESEFGMQYFNDTDGKPPAVSNAIMGKKQVELRMFSDDNDNDNEKSNEASHGLNKFGLISQDKPIPPINTFNSYIKTKSNDQKIDNFSAKNITTTNKPIIVSSVQTVQSTTVLAQQQQIKQKSKANDDFDQEEWNPESIKKALAISNARNRSKKVEPVKEISSNLDFLKKYQRPQCKSFIQNDREQHEEEVYSDIEKKAKNVSSSVIDKLEKNNIHSKLPNNSVDVTGKQTDKKPAPKRQRKKPSQLALPLPHQNTTNHLEQQQKTQLIKPSQQKVNRNGARTPAAVIVEKEVKMISQNQGNISNVQKCKASLKLADLYSMCRPVSVRKTTQVSPIGNFSKQVYRDIQDKQERKVNVKEKEKLRSMSEEEQQEEEKGESKDSNSKIENCEANSQEENQSDQQQSGSHVNENLVQEVVEMMPIDKESQQEQEEELQNVQVSETEEKQEVNNKISASKESINDIKNENQSENGNNESADEDAAENNESSKDNPKDSDYGLSEDEQYQLLNARKKNKFNDLRSKHMFLEHQHQNKTKPKEINRKLNIKQQFKQLQREANPCKKVKLENQNSIFPKSDKSFSHHSQLKKQYMKDQYYNKSYMKVTQFEPTQEKRNMPREGIARKTYAYTSQIESDEEGELYVIPKKGSKKGKEDPDYSGDSENRKKRRADYTIEREDKYIPLRFRNRDQTVAQKLYVRRELSPEQKVNAELHSKHEKRTRYRGQENENVPALQVCLLNETEDMLDYDEQFGIVEDEEFNQNNRDHPIKEMEGDQHGTKENNSQNGLQEDKQEIIESQAQESIAIKCNEQQVEPQISNENEQIMTIEIIESQKDKIINEDHKENTAQIVVQEKSEIDAQKQIQKTDQSQEKIKTRGRPKGSLNKIQQNKKHVIQTKQLKQQHNKENKKQIKQIPKIALKQNVGAASKKIVKIQLKQQIAKILQQDKMITRKKVTMNYKTQEKENQGEYKIQKKRDQKMNTSSISNTIIE